MDQTARNATRKWEQRTFKIVWFNIFVAAAAANVTIAFVVCVEANVVACIEQLFLLLLLL